MNIILLGYMASGKSTVGRLLATSINFEFIDLDEYIEGKEGISVSEIFETNGEIYFRKKEHNCLKEILSKKDKYVLSLGGGTPCYAGNMELIKSSGKTISFYLKASVNELVGRLINEKDQRPLVTRFNNEDELTEFIGKHLFERNHFYNQSDHQILIDGKSKEKVVEEILLNLY